MNWSLYKKNIVFFRQFFVSYNFRVGTDHSALTYRASANGAKWGPSASRTRAWRILYHLSIKKCLLYEDPINIYFILFVFVIMASVKILTITLHTIHTGNKRTGWQRSLWISSRFNLYGRVRTPKKSNNSY